MGPSQQSHVKSYGFWAPHPKTIWMHMESGPRALKPRVHFKSWPEAPKTCEFMWFLGPGPQNHKIMFGHFHIHFFFVFYMFWPATIKNHIKNNDFQSNLPTCIYFNFLGKNKIEHGFYIFWPFFSIMYFLLTSAY